MLKKMGKSVLGILMILGICSIWVWSRAAEPPAVARLSGVEKARVIKLIEGAKKEGELVGSSNLWRPDVQAEMIPKFREEYGFSESDVRVKILSLRTDAIITKVTEELQAKVYKHDVIQNGAPGWFNDLVARGQLMAYDSLEYKHFHPAAVSPETGQSNHPYYVSEAFGLNGIVYNPKYVEREIVHWKDVLRPEYKGKISCGDVSKSLSYTVAYLAIRQAGGVDFFAELGKLNPFVLVSASELVNKCITGEFPIVVIGSTGTAYRTNLKGAGLKLVHPPEGYGTVGYPTAILARAPHPNAAKLWIDFLHSEAGQKLILEKACYPIGRMGIQSGHLDYPKPIYEIEGLVKLDWRKIGSQDYQKAQEEFRRLVIEK